MNRIRHAYRRFEYRVETANTTKFFVIADSTFGIICVLAAVGLLGAIIASLLGITVDR